MPSKKSKKSSKSRADDPDVNDDEMDHDIFSEEEGELEDPSDDDHEADEASHAQTAADPEIMDLHKQVETALFAQEAPSEGIFAAAEAYQGSNNVLGVGIGSAEIDSDQISDDGPGTPVLNVYVAEPTTMEDVRRCMVDSFSVRALSRDKTPVNVICTGVIEAQPHRHKERPSPNGISIGHKDITAGTQGVLTRGRTGSRRRRVLILSNNHVLADVNAGRRGDAILQPGPTDGGQNPRDRIAILERFVNIHFDGRPNFVDCATGWAWHKKVRKEFIYRAGSNWRHFDVSDQTRAAHVGMNVGKSGRTTQLTAGRVTDVNASIRVNFGQGRIANYRDQITIRGHSGDFSQGGDSGSLIWTWDRTRNPVGLLFAGGGGFTFANKINRVLTALDLRLHT